MKNTQRGLEALMKSTIDDINTVLRKSGYLAKDDSLDQEDELEAQAAQDEAPMEPEMGEMAPEEGESSEQGEQGEMGAEESDDLAAMEEHLSTMSDEELHMLMELIQGEIMHRQQAGESQEVDEGEDGDEGQHEGQLQMSMKKEFASMAKSMRDIAGAVKAVAQQNSALQREVSALKKSRKGSAVARPAAANSRQFQALSKSGGVEGQTKAEPLTKSDIEGFLMNEMRKSSSQRHPAVNSQLIADLTYVKTPSQVREFAASLRKQGVQLPS